MMLKYLKKLLIAFMIMFHFWQEAVVGNTDLKILNGKAYRMTTQSGAGERGDFRHTLHSLKKMYTFEKEWRYSGPC